MPGFHVVAANLIENDGEYLLVQEGKEAVRNEWNLPAGGVDPDERIQDAAVREAREETGLEVELENLIGVFVDESDISDATVLIFVFHASTENPDPKVPENDEIKDVGFFPQENFSKMKIRIPFLDEAVERFESDRFLPLQTVKDFR